MSSPYGPISPMDPFVFVADPDNKAVPSFANAKIQPTSIELLTTTRVLNEFSDSGKMFICNGGSAFTITAPAPTDPTDAHGFWCIIVNLADNRTTIDCGATKLVMTGVNNRQNVLLGGTTTNTATGAACILYAAKDSAGTGLKFYCLHNDFNVTSS